MNELAGLGQAIAEAIALKGKIVNLSDRRSKLTERHLFGI